MGVIGVEEDAIAEERDAAIGTQRGIACNRAGGGARPGVFPDFTAGSAIESRYLVGGRDEHHATRDERRRLERLILDRINPLELKARGVTRVDLIDGAVTVSVQGAVVGGPIARFGVKKGLEFAFRGLGHGAEDRSPCTAERAQPSHKVALFVGQGVYGGHQRCLLSRDLRVVFVAKEMHNAIRRFELQIVTAAAAGESAQRLAVLEGHVHDCIAWGYTRARIGQRLLQFR
jgi:hypothetical protein